MNEEPKRTISFSPPDMSELEEKEVVDTLRSGWITTGPRTKKLEHELAAFVGVRDGLKDGEAVADPNLVCLNSATASEELIFHVLGVGPGDEVIIPAYTYSSSAAAALHVGAKIVFIDCQADSLEMDYEKVRAAINAHTKAIVPVDLGGVPCDYDKIFSIVTDPEVRKLFTPLEADESDDDLTKLGSRIQKNLGRVAIVSDGAHALGAHRFVTRSSSDPEGRNGCKDLMVGSIADFTSFSFHAVNVFKIEGDASFCYKELNNTRLAA